MAVDPTLGKNEKIGFPDSYRQGFDDRIFRDIRRKLPLLGREKKVVLDIGPGCAGLADRLIELCGKKKHSLILADSQEMLSLLPDRRYIRKIPGMFPRSAGAVTASASGGCDVILCYSVLHYIFVDSNVWEFLDRSIELLRPGGQMLIGDIPNISMRRRFFASERGIQFHKKFMKTGDTPSVAFNSLDVRDIDDAVVLGLVTRARNAGVDAFVVPQPANLPMANRREDLLLYKP